MEKSTGKDYPIIFKKAEDANEPDMELKHLKNYHTSMNQQTLIQMNVTSIVCKTLTLETIGFEEDLIDSGLLDSLSLVQLMVTLEEEFKIRIEPEEIDFEDYRSVKSMSEMIFLQLLMTTLPIRDSG